MRSPVAGGPYGEAAGAAGAAGAAAGASADPPWSAVVSGLAAGASAVAEVEPGAEVAAPGVRLPPREAARPGAFADAAEPRCPAETFAATETQQGRIGVAVGATAKAAATTAVVVAVTRRPLRTTEVSDDVRAWRGMACEDSLFPEPLTGLADGFGQGSPTGAVPTGTTPIHPGGDLGPRLRPHPRRGTD